MTGIDVVILVIVGFFCVKGFFRGFIVEVFTLVGLLLAYVVALREMSTVSAWLDRTVNLPPLLSTTLGFLAVFILVALFFRWLAGALRFLARRIMVGWIDRGGGVLFGLFKGAFVASLLALLISLIPFSGGMRREQERSLLFRPVLGVAPAVFDFLKHTFPKTKSFYEEMKEGFSDASRRVVDEMLSKRLDSIQQAVKENGGEK